MEPIILFFKAHVSGYIRGGRFVKPYERKGGAAASSAAPGQLALFTKPAAPSKPNPFKGKDPIASTPDMFDDKPADPALDPERIARMAAGRAKHEAHEAEVRAHTAPEREARYQAALNSPGPQWETLEGVDIMRIPGSNFAALPITGKRNARVFQAFNVKTREPITQLKKDEVREWLRAMRRTEQDVPA